MAGRREQEEMRERLTEDYLRAAGDASPQARPGFEETSWHRIQGRLAGEGEMERRTAPRSPAPHHRVRWAVLVPAMTLVLMMLFTTGAFAFSRNAAPDSSLYGTKLFFERTRLAFTGSSEAKVDYEMELANKRLEELEGMITRRAQRGGPHWEAAYRSNVGRLYAEIMNLPEERRAEVFEYAAGLLEEQAEAMSVLYAEAPQSLSPNIEEARSCGMGTMECMREHCRQHGGEGGGSGGNGSSGNGSSGGNCPGGSCPGGSGNGKQ